MKPACCPCIEKNHTPTFFLNVLTIPILFIVFGFLPASTLHSQPYTINFEIIGNGTVLKVPDQASYEADESVELTPSAENGYSFTEWSGDASGNEIPLTIIMNSDKNITAVFSLKKYELNVVTDGTAGAITDPSGATLVNHGEATPILANAPDNYTFLHWTVEGGLAALENPSLSSTAVTLTDGDANIQANFSINEYTLTYSAGPNGTLSGPQVQTIEHGSNGEPVTATPDAGYLFSGWSDGVTDNPRTDINITGDITVQAEFEIRTYTLTYSAGPNGTLSGSLVQTLEHGSSGEPVTATPNAGYLFSRWSDGVTDNPRTDINITGDITVQAEFEIRTYTLTYSAGPNGTLSGPQVQTVEHGSSGEPVTATPNAGYLFSRWSDGVTDNPRTDINITGDITIQAEFEIRTYTLTYSAGPNGSLSGPLLQSIEHGSSGEPVTAVPNEGYQYSVWSDGVTANPRLDSNVTRNISAIANFTSIPPTAELAGSTSICSGSAAELSVALSGIAPWEITYSDGSNNFTLANIIENIHSFTVTPISTKTYTLIRVIDSYGKEGTVTGNAVVTVSPRTVGGSVSGGNQEIVLTQSTGPLSLTGQTGEVIKWEKRHNSGAWNDINNITLSYSEIPPATGTYSYRALVQSGVCDAAPSDHFDILVSESPVIEDARYDASNGHFDIYGQHLNTGRQIESTRLTISRGTQSFRLTSLTTNVVPSSSTRATIVIAGKDRAFFNWILNDDGLRSREGDHYHLSVEENWNGLALADQTITVSLINFQSPSIVSAVFNKRESTLDINATSLAAMPEPVKDINSTLFTITGRNNETHSLTSASPDVNVLSDTRFIINIGEADKTIIDQLIDIVGTESSTGNSYNLAAAEGWNRAVHADHSIADLTGNPIEAVEIDNHPPRALDVAITGTPIIGNTITGTYVYSDLEGDAEADTQYSWYRAEDPSGTGETLIGEAIENRYTLSLEDASRFLAFEVIPAAESGTSPGSPVRTDWIEVGNSAPTVYDVTINGLTEVCKVLTAVYEYFDAEEDPEGETQIKWYRADDDSGTNEQEIHVGPTHTLALNDQGKFLLIRVFPQASSGTPVGIPVKGLYYGPVVNKLPTVSITGPAGLCQGSEVEIVFDFTGSAPWEISYTDGTNEHNFSSTTSRHALSVSEGGEYMVTRLVDESGCDGIDLGNVLEIEASSTVLIDEWYTETFANGTSGWISTLPAGHTVNSWTFGPPQGDIFTSASAGSNIWYTDIANFNISEQSSVTSPCFDFTLVKRPMIAIDLWKEFGQDSDGSVLQYSADNGYTWRNIGQPGQGVNWYNSSHISGMPGGQQTGWTASDSEKEWTESRHYLDVLAGAKYVRFRIAYGSDGSGGSTGGMAFDNIRIGERSRLVLLEHFTNTNNLECIAANQTIHDIYQINKPDFAFISYHTSFPSGDPINNKNTADPGTRALYYNVSTVPFSVMDGGLDGGGRYNYSPAGFNESDLHQRALIDPYFKIEISQNQVNNDLSIELELKSIFSFGPFDMTLHMAVLETEVTASQAGIPGNNIYRNVVRKLLPNAGGTNLPASWTANQTAGYSFNWTIENVFNTENLALIAFIQDENTKEIYQVGTSSEFGIPTFIDSPDQVAKEPSIIFYPNPATDYLLIEFQKTIIEEHRLEIYNLSGRMIHTDILKSGRSDYEFNTSGLSRGIYFFVIKNNRETLSTARIIIFK
jgi:hypothetical protein